MARVSYGADSENTLAKGLASPLPQKSITPVPAPWEPSPVAAPAPAQAPTNPYSNLPDLGAGGYGAGATPAGWKLNADTAEAIARDIGFTGNPTAVVGRVEAGAANEGGDPLYNDVYGASPGLIEAFKNYNFTQQNQGRDTYTNVTGLNGQPIGSYKTVDGGSAFDAFVDKAIPAVVGAGATLGLGSALGLFGGGAGSAAGGMSGGGAAGDIGFLAANGMSDAAIASAFPQLGAAGGLTGIGVGTGGALAAAAAESPFEQAVYSPNDFSGFQYTGAADTGTPYLGAAADSQAASSALGITGDQAAAAATLPSSANLGSLGTYSTGAGLTDKLANALQAAAVNPAGTAASAASGLAGFAKANPGIALAGASALGSLLGGTPSMPSLTGGTGSTGALSSEAQALANSQGALNFSNIPSLKTSAGDINSFNQSAIDAAYNQQTRYLDPQIKQQQAALESRLAEQGFVPGTPAYNQAMQNFMDTNQRAYAQARDSSILQGTQIGQSDYRNAISNATLNNSAAAQALQQYITQRNQPINERNALLTGDQILYDRTLDQYNAQVAESNSRNQALSQLALALGMYLG